MSLANVFNTPVTAAVGPKGGPRPAAAQETHSISNFVTPQSLASFPGASFVVALVTQAIRSVAGHESQTSSAIPFAVSIVVGVVIFLIGVSDEKSASRPTTRIGWGVAIFIALINSLFLYMAAIGALQTVAGKPADTTPTG